MGTGDGNVHSAKLDTTRSLRPDEPRPRSRRPLYTARGTRTCVRAARRGIWSRDGRGIAGKAAVSAVLVQQTPEPMHCGEQRAGRSDEESRHQPAAPPCGVGYRPDQARPAECGSTQPIPTPRSALRPPRCADTIPHRSNVPVPTIPGGPHAPPQLNTSELNTYRYTYSLPLRH